MNGRLRLVDGNLDVAVHAIGPRVTVLELCGDLDLYTAPRLNACVDEVFKRDVSTVILGLQEMHLVDEDGVGAIIRVHRRACERGAVVHLATTQEYTLRILRTMGLTDVFRVFDTLEQAVEACHVRG